MNNERETSVILGKPSLNPEATEKKKIVQAHEDDRLPSNHPAYRQRGPSPLSKPGSVRGIESGTYHNFMRRKSFSSITHIHLITLFQIFSEVLLSFKFFLFFPDNGNIEAGITYLISYSLEALICSSETILRHGSNAVLHMSRT